ncbi:MAG: flagellar protein FlgN [Chthoniobacter sp.]|nr:flagellar protein FlgN [Chthoniobacter sp.]
MIGIAGEQVGLAEWQGQIVEALRAEVVEYGGLLNCFDEQQGAILARDPEAVTVADESIQRQLVTTRQRRAYRENLVAGLAGATGFPQDSSLTALKEQFAAPIWPMVQALISEVNRLITRARHRAQQNQMLLARTIEITQEVVAGLRPGTVTRTYSPQGRVKIMASAGGGRLLEKS